MRVRGCALIIEDNKLLTLAYDYPNGRIHAIPGGGIEDGETLAQSVAREFDEELGLTIETGRLRFVGDMMANEHIKQTLHVIFEGRIRHGEPKLNSKETSAVEVVWLDMSRLNEYKLYPAVNDALLEDHRGDVAPRYLGNCMQREWA